MNINLNLRGEEEGKDIETELKNQRTKMLSHSRKLRRRKRKLWNNPFFPGEEDELYEETKALPHIIFGRDREGKILLFTIIGAVGFL